MVDNITYGNQWSDPGATANDDVDGNLTSAIQTFGVGSVDPNRPTAERSMGYVVEYYVEDTSRNAAPIARRLVKVICPEAERVCTDPDSNLLTCTIKQLCGKQLSTLSSAGSTAAFADTSSSSAGSTAGAAATVARSGLQAVPKQPNITLVGPSTQEVLAGTVYDRCSLGAPVGTVCDEGAIAEDAKDGNLNRMVMVCGNR